MCEKESWDTLKSMSGKEVVLTKLQKDILAVLEKTKGIELESLAEKLGLQLSELQREIATLRHMEKLKLNDPVFRIAPPPPVGRSGTRTSEGFLPCQAKNQELRPLVLKQLDFLNAWQGKKPDSFGS